MNINYDLKNNDFADFSDFSNDENDLEVLSLDNEDLLQEQSDPEVSLEKSNENYTYSPSIRLVGKKSEITHTTGENHEHEGNDLTINKIKNIEVKIFPKAQSNIKKEVKPALSEALPDINAEFSLILDNFPHSSTLQKTEKIETRFFSNTESIEEKKFIFDKDLEIDIDVRKKSLSERKIFQTHYIAQVENLENIEKGVAREIQVNAVDLSKPESYNVDKLEELEKSHKLGLLMLIPKKEETGPIQVQENLGKLLQKHKINQVKATMPDNQTKVFANVQFQTISGSTSLELASGFSEIAIIIYSAHKEVENQEKQKVKEFENHQTSLSGNNKNLNETEVPRSKQVFQLCFYVVSESTYNKTSEIIDRTNAKAENDIKESRELEDKADKKDEKIKADVKKSETKQNIIKDNNKSTDIQKDTNKNKEIKNQQINVLKKKKVKDSADPEALPIDIIDMTKEKNLSNT